jgi:multidrug efflux pump
MGDVVGRLFREFAITLAVSILISAFVSLTLTPMMCARLLKPETGHSTNRFLQWSERSFEQLTHNYAKWLSWVLDRQRATLWVAVGTLAFTVLLYLLVPKGFFPLQDTGMVQVITEAPQTISFGEMATRQQAVVDAVLQDPAVDTVSSFIGIDGVNVTLNNGRILINLKPKHARDSDIRKILNRLQTRTQPIEGITAYYQSVQDLTIENRISKTQYQMSVQDANADELALWVPHIVNRLREIHSLKDVASDIQNEGLQAYLEIDRSTAARMGITTVAIDNALYNAFGQRLISSIFTQSNVYRVVLEVEPIHKQGLDALNQLFVISSNGTPVPFSAFTTVTEKATQLSINHLGQFPAALISFDLAKGASLGDAVKEIRQAIEELDPPTSIETKFQGSANAYEASLQNTLLLILAAIVTMYIVLGVLYESYIHPVTILSTLPSAAVGALLALMLTQTDLGIIAIIGIILLIGIVKKNAIMMIDFALQAEREEGKSPRDAIYEACLLRLRPILMTTMAALLGALPLMIGTGVGSELRHPLGLIMVGGLIFSQVLTLFTTPVIYLAFDRLAHAWRQARPQ